jgi:HEAT repeat protein
VQADLQPRIFRALGRIGHPGARDAILDGMRSSEWQVRSAAAEAAGKVGLTDAINPLTGLLEDEHWWTRFRAAEALTRLGNSGRRALLAAASEAATPLARGAASATLAEHRLA